MRIVGFILAACLALAVLKAAIAVLLCVVACAFLVAFISRPAEVLALLVYGLLCALLNSYTIPMLVGVVVLVAVGWIARRGKN